MNMHTILTNFASININILPIIMIPAAALCTLLFYNRLAALSSVVRLLQKEVVILQANSSLSDDEKNSHFARLQADHDTVLKRSDKLRNAIVFLLSGIIAFNLSAIFIMLSVLDPILSIITIILWLLGAVLYCIGLIIGTFEIRAPAFELILTKHF